MRILVVDDSVMDRKIAGGLLSNHADWEVHYAVNGKEALDQMELHMPDLVVTDLQMPEMDGLQLVQHIRENYPLIPVVLMTAQGSEEIAVQALQQGAASYVPKKRLARDLAEIAERVLTASGQERTSMRLMNRMRKNEIEFVLENDLSLVHSVVGFLQEAVSRVRLCSEADQLRLGVALEEALVNAFYHGNLEVSSSLREEDHREYYELAQRRSKEEPYKDRRIHVSAYISPMQAVYKIRDEGPGFDPHNLPDPIDPANLDRPCGRGVLLMRTFMDDVQFNPAGNEVTLTKRRVDDKDHTGEAEQAED